MHRKSKTAALAALAALLLAAPVQAATWKIDSAHSAAQFSVKHMMISTVRGAFNSVAGTVEYDGKDISTVKVDATIESGTIDTRVTKRDEHLKSPDFLDAAKFPTITFKSKKAEAAGSGKFRLTGDLTMRGITKEVVLDVEGPSAELKDGYGNARIGAHATTKINRQDFGVNWSKTLDGGGMVVSDEVTVELDLELVNKVEAPAAKPEEKPAAKPADKPSAK